MYKNSSSESSGGIMNEHLWCRSSGKASIFDVSHMGQIIFRGTDRVSFLESLVVGDVKGLSTGNSCLSLLMNPNGGIIDDTVITNAGEYIYMVINGATKVTDIEHIQKQMLAFNGDVQLELLDESYELIALQGPGAVDAIVPFLPQNFDISKMKFMSSTEIRIHNVDCRMTRYVLHFLIFHCSLPVCCHGVLCLLKGFTTSTDEFFRFFVYGILLTSDHVYI